MEECEWVFFHVFSLFLNCTNGTKSRNTPHISIVRTMTISVSYQLLLQLFHNHDIFHDTCHHISFSFRWRGTGLIA